MTGFDDDTSVRVLADGTLEATIDRGWWIVNGPNGGYVAAIVARAVDAAAADPSRTLRTLSVHYLRPPVAGTARLDVHPARVGRTVTTWTFRMLQGERVVLVGSATSTAARPALEFHEVEVPQVPRPDDVLAVEFQRSEIAMHGRYEMRPCFGPPPWGHREADDRDASRPARAGGWIRLADRTPVDRSVLVAMVDAWWPPVFSKLGSVAMAVPTVDLTIHLLSVPDDPGGWVLGEYVSEVATGGYLIEDARLFSEDGRLLALGRQLAVFI